jgi:transcriptional regulator with XRE-family HTH domain
MKPKNPLRRWLSQQPMSQAEFARRAGISVPFLATLLQEQAPWPSRSRLRRIVKATRGAVTADQWLALDDPPARVRRH